MFYIKKDEENREALGCIKNVLDAHITMLQDREEELLSFATDAMKDEINHLLSHSSQNSDQNHVRLEALQAEIEVLDIKIAAIQYTYDYVKLMLKQCKISEKDI